MRNSAFPQCSGFSLVEVLVAVVVLSIGLLGLAGLQAMGLRNNQSAYLRSQATLQAYDMADRMRANLPGVKTGAYNSITGTPSNPGCISTGCSPAQIAQYDAYEWNTTNAAVLPSGQGTVQNNNGIFTITLSWDDNHSGAADTQFTLRFQP